MAQRPYTHTPHTHSAIPKHTSRHTNTHIHTDTFGRHSQRTLRTQTHDTLKHHHTLNTHTAIDICTHTHTPDILLYFCFLECLCTSTEDTFPLCLYIFCTFYIYLYITRKQCWKLYTCVHFFVAQVATFFGCASRCFI